MAAVLALAGTMGFSAARDIYPDPSAAKADLAAALKTAAASHKRVIVDFGGNWCGDCKVLDIYLHNEQNRPILEANYVLVHVNVSVDPGEIDKNLEIAERWGIPLSRGVPALAVLSENGKLLYAQRGAEFEKMRLVQPGDVTKFLVQWRAPKAGCSVMVVNC